MVQCVPNLIIDGLNSGQPRSEFLQNQTDRINNTSTVINTYCEKGEKSVDFALGAFTVPQHHSQVEYHLVLVARKANDHHYSTEKTHTQTKTKNDPQKLENIW